MAATRPDELHDADFYAWTRDQAAALRRLAAERWNGPLDLERFALVERQKPDAARALPAASPYALDDLLTDDWYPASRHGLADEV